MAVSSNHIIDPQSIQDLKDFEWIVRLLANGFMHGKHTSTRLGTGNEFQQFRPYVSGDDIRSIDWKMYAKTDKFYIKQTHIETEHNYLFIIDQSRSMLYTENGWSKWMLAKLLIAAMMRIVANQGDRFGWQTTETAMALDTGMRHWQHSIHKLYGLETSTLSQDLIPLKFRDVTTIWISDFYEPVEVIQQRMKRFVNPTTELIMFHVLGEAEKNISFGRNTTFVDLESGDRVDVNVAMAKNSYTEKLNHHRLSIKNRALELGAIYEEVSMNKPFRGTLSTFFHHYRHHSA